MRNIDLYPTRALTSERRRKREREREREGERERRKSPGERGTEALESICPETDLRNPSQPTDTQN